MPIDADTQKEIDKWQSANQLLLSQVAEITTKLQALPVGTPEAKTTALETKLAALETSLAATQTALTAAETRLATIQTLPLPPSPPLPKPKGEKEVDPPAPKTGLPVHPKRGRWA